MLRALSEPVVSTRSSYKTERRLKSLPAPERVNWNNTKPLNVAHGNTIPIQVMESRDALGLEIIDAEPNKDGNEHALLASLDIVDICDEHASNDMPSKFPHDDEEMPIARHERTKSFKVDVDCLVQLHSILHTYFGQLTQFRVYQPKPIIDAVEGKNVALIAPTGSGKSMCFQVPAIYQEGARHGMTVIITPLIALMEEQAQKLLKEKVSVMWYHRDMSDRKKSKVLQAMEFERPPAIFYVSPEWLFGSAFQNYLLKGNSNLIARFVLDEAHLYKQWGHSFRTSYLRIPEIRDAFPEVPWTLVSGTMTLCNMKELITLLKLNILPTVAPLDRPNLYYSVTHTERVLPSIAQYIMKRPRQVGIIFCNLKSDCRRVAKSLEEKYEVSVTTFFAGDKKREDNMRDWKGGKYRVMVATCALGHGIDRSVSYTIHHDIPGSLEMLLQETGRAGRNGSPADCLIYFRASSINKMTLLLQRDKFSMQDMSPMVPFSDTYHQDELRKVVEFCMNNTVCRRQGLLSPFMGSQSRPQCGACDVCCKPSTAYLADITPISRWLLKTFGELQSRGWLKKISSKELIESAYKKIQSSEFRLHKQQSPGKVALLDLLKLFVVNMYRVGIFDIKVLEYWHGEAGQMRKSYYLKRGSKASHLEEGTLSVTMSTTLEVVRDLGLKFVHQEP